ncbi:DNRLRE domain-containing protein [Lysobacter enzymogenes]|uniref:DNRLRE domain-containing protein n=1 Tax=Lysobacter enzymogenes TaxID=69 RepID=UPI0037496023
MTLIAPRAPLCAALATALLGAAALAPAHAAQRTLQLSEDATYSKPVAASALRGTPLAKAGAADRVCEAGAKWLRVGFKQLKLAGYDSLVLTSSGGDKLVFEGKHWNQRSFTTRALRGECVDIQPYFSQPDSAFQLDRYDYSAVALDKATVVVAGAGDICDTSGNACQGTSDLIVSINPTAVFTAGDNAYNSGTLSEYNNRYAPTWGRFKALTSPSPGNHDYSTTGAKGYFDYFNGSGNQTGPAGDRSKGYYSWDVGDWHFIALNTMSGGTVAQTQIDWLKSDLAANTKPCTAAYFHHPLLSRGSYSGYSQVKPFWDALYAAKADLVLVGHDHNYQRYGKMNPDKAAASDGIRQVLVGTGGRAFYGISGSHALLEASNDSTFGVLKLTLTASGYTGDFVPRAGSSYSDHFTGTCNKGNGNPPSQTLTLNSVRDVTVKSGGSRDNGATLYADGSDGGQVLRGLMGWDVSAAAGKTLTGAQVKLQVSDRSAGTYDLYAAGAAWTEANASYSGVGLGAKIGSVVPNATGAQSIALNAAGLQLVKNWASGAVANNGVVLASSSSDGVDWSSREGANAPQLILTYTP